MKRQIIILSIVFLIIFFGIFELFFVKNTLQNLDKKIDTLKIEISENENNIITSKDHSKSLKIYWKNKLKILNFLFDYKELNEITNTILKLETYISNNDFSNAICEINLLKNQTTLGLKFMGFSIFNIL